MSSYTDKKYGVCLEWHYTEGRAKQILEYERPVIRKRKPTFEQLSVNDIRELNDAKIWNNPDCNRPSFYCLQVQR